MYNPVATYRVQFHKGFTLRDLETYILYLQNLGVKTIYASPVFKATPGSTHGYDVLDPNTINPEIGTEEELKELIKKLQQQGIGWLQDIVPNHMAFDTRNPWVLDLLEKGPQSAFSPFFDITWTSPLHQGRLMVPFLGDSLEESIKNGEIKLAYQDEHFVLKYYDAVYPLHPRSYETILAENKGPQAIQQLLQQMEGIKRTEDRRNYAAMWSEFILQLAATMKNKISRRYIDEVLNKFNEDTNRLEQIVHEQNYRLCHWQEANGQINYRRFFTVNGLICLNIHDKAVLEEHHGLINSWISEGIFNGLRVDHIDGLYNPEQYLQQLREIAGTETYIIVEKILEPGEALPAHWPVQGNTGYDFLSLVNNLFTQKKSEEAFIRFYNALTNETRSVAQQARDKKSAILYQHMGGELNNLFHLFMESDLISEADYAHMRTEDIKTAIAEFLIHCPVYRYYGNNLPLQNDEQMAVEGIWESVKASRPDLSPAVDIIAGVLLHRAATADEEYKKRALHFYQRCMQFTGPLMAKGVEDTLMYTYNYFIAHNEVGDSPDAFGLLPKEFHVAMKNRQKHWPLSLNATATHDTKRGEDVRARLNVLSDLPTEWLKTVEEWQSMNATVKENDAPDSSEEYFIYQTLAGTYPMPGEDEGDYGTRLEAYIQKALREAKRNSNWTNPNERYENAVKKFALSLLSKNKPFWKSFQALQQKIIDFGIVNSLVQTILKFTCPGLPDVYQGAELWDLSFVDPDNRRVVHYKKRNDILESLDQQKEDPQFLEKLWENRHDGAIKLWLTQKLFHLRKTIPFLDSGDYIPLTTEGKLKDHVLAFARKRRNRICIIVVPLHLASLCATQKVDMLSVNWQDTKILLPDDVEPEWEDLLTGLQRKEQNEIKIEGLFQSLPFVILKGSQKLNERSAGILLHISSLPSAFGIGDMGPEAYRFADFLSRNNQRYWQVLPLGPTEGGQAHSPYSSISSRAGNSLFISPEWLVQKGLLQRQELPGCYLPQQGKTLYQEAEKVKKELLHHAFERYKAEGTSIMQIEFQQFREKEKTWIRDFASYGILKQKHEGRPWYEWDAKFKFREAKALSRLLKEHETEIEEVEWIQYIFAQQWKALKTYCNELGIHMIGDLPIYISYDSADVWAEREFFCLDKEGKRTGMAGVPPDAFSEEGQLWGMPVYRWDVLKDRGYDWWMDRLKKNRELFDLIRLDHFRAFADYWEVPAGETTAKNGQWKPGPGAHFFETVQKTLGELPFIAEDLGDVNEAVYQLRDRFHLPGMKVLQFAFDEGMPTSEHIPHNYTSNFVVYTGTHDNNTTRGWFRDETDAETKYRLQQYGDRELNEDQIPHFLCRMAYASVANTVILPLQDVLGLDGMARMNIPASTENNWAWRLLPGQVTAEAEDNLKLWAGLYNRE